MVETRTVKITRAEHEKLKKDSSELEQNKQELAKNKQELAKLKAQLEKYQNRSSPVKIKYSSSKKKKVQELNADLVKHVKLTVKNYVFRYVKFIENEKQEKKCTKKILEHLAVPLPAGMSEEEFIEDYSYVVYTTIKTTAQSLQNNAKKRAKGMCFVL